jgi:SAM-dependent methyltransferase
MDPDAIQIQYEQQATLDKNMTISSRITNPECVETWRHNRKLAYLKPFFSSFPEASWLTIGDGRFGADAFFLKNNRVDVLATSITDHTLKQAKEKGYIDKYKAENAENLSFTENSFDFVLCKESYHHFPRPAIAFYEMLRVARIAVILIEPVDDRKGILGFLKPFIKKKWKGEHSYFYEKSGNYIFRVNPEEIRKMLVAVNRPYFSIRRFNDIYIEKFADKLASLSSFGYLFINFLILLHNVLSALRILAYGKSVVVSFNSPIDLELENKLKSFGFKVVSLPNNPYADRI